MEGADERESLWVLMAETAWERKRKVMKEKKKKWKCLLKVFMVWFVCRSRKIKHERDKNDGNNANLMQASVCSLLLHTHIYNIIFCGMV